MHVSKKTCVTLVAACQLAASIALAQAISLPDRAAARPDTTNSVPHQQLGVVPVPSLVEKMLDQVDALPGVGLDPTRISLPGTIGFHLDRDMQIMTSRAAVGGREFAHLHPDGSLHATLLPDIAAQAVRAGWATPHPWATLRPGWDGFVMIYTPRTESELEIVLRLIEQAYLHVTGRTKI